MNKIKVDPQAFVWGDIEDFEEVETEVDLESMYKDLAPATTICKQLSTGKFFALDWQQYTSHYGSGESQFYEDEAYEVELKEETKTIVVKNWVAVKE